MHERAVAFFQECLKRPEGARAREYLAGRGLDEDMIARFRIGYAPDSGFLLRDRLKNEFSEEVLRESGLFSWKQDDTTSDASVVATPRMIRTAWRPTRSTMRSPRASGHRSRAAIAAMYSKFRNRVMFPIASEAGKGHRLHRTHTRHR